MPDVSSTHSFLSGGGATGRLMRETDWARTPLGPVDAWPQSLRSMVGACLNSPLLGAVLWGPELVMLYNDAYVPSMADRHPAALGKPVAEVWGAAWQQVAAPFVECLRTGKGFAQQRVELQIVRQGRSELTYWNITATPIYGEAGDVAGIFNQGVEITEQVRSEHARSQAEQDLRLLNATLERRVVERAEALRLYETIVQAHQSPVCAFDHAYRVIAFNRAHSDEFFRIFGHRVQLGDVFPDLFPPVQRDVMRGFMDRALSGEVYTVVEEFGDPALVKPYWEVSYYPLRDEAGRIFGAFHHANDISARLRTQSDLDAAQASLRQSQKMEAVGQLTGGLAHDFNNLLAAIGGSLEVVERNMASGRIDKVDRFLLVARGAVKRAAALTHRLLAFSRRQTLDPKPVNVNRLVSDMEELVRRTVGPAVQVEVVGAGGLWSTLVDASQLENALLNLCINARDAMPDGGRLTIETANKWLDSRGAAERELAPGQYISLCVSDSGVGMTPAIAAKAFDPFFTTKPLGLGTGLGLSMVYGFARQSGGQVRIYSEVGEGTTICIYLPRHETTVTTDTSTAAPASSEAGEGEVVLVIDDEPSIRALLVEVLEESGYVVLEAVDGPSGLKVLESVGRVDLLITDVGLPNGMNGRQVADAARVMRPGLRVLFITGYAENAVVGNGHVERWMSVVTKPFEVDVLARRVKDILRARAEE